jgi:hypothetical protein
VDNKLLLVVLAALVAVGALILFSPGPRDEPPDAAEEAVAPALLPANLATPAASEPDAQAADVPEGTVSLTQTPAETAASPAASPRRVIATYFHNTTRCYTCRAIEQLARETIESTFAAELASGRMAWRALNMELRENEHCAIDYALTSPSLVLALTDGDREVRFKVLGETWTLIHTKAKFVAYVAAEVRAMLEGE